MNGKIYAIITLISAVVRNKLIKYHDYVRITLIFRYTF